MHVVKDEDPLQNPIVQQFLKDVLIKEEEAFSKIFTRFCLLNGVRYDISKILITPMHNERPNYGEYYYIGSIQKATGTKHFLMSRDVEIVDGESLPVLKIVFNKDLLDETTEKI